MSRSCSRQAGLRRLKPGWNRVAGLSCSLVTLALLGGAWPLRAADDHADGSEPVEHAARDGSDGSPATPAASATPAALAAPAAQAAPTATPPASNTPVDVAEPPRDSGAAAPAGVSAASAAPVFRPKMWAIGALAGVGGWRHNFGLAGLSGAEGGGGFEILRLHEAVRYTLTLEGISIAQLVESGIVGTTLAEGEGGGQRSAQAGLLALGAGYQWEAARLQPYVAGRVGLAAGYDQTRVDLRITTGTLTPPTGTLYGYTLDQTIVHQGPLLTPSVALEIGIAPLFLKRQSLELGVQGLIWPKNRTFAMGLILRYLHGVGP